MAEYDRHLLDGEHLGHLISKIKAADAANIANPATKSSGNFLKYDGTNWVAANVPESGVLSVDAATGETVVVVDNTDAANPRIGLAISATQGNVTLTKESDGLKANIPNYVAYTTAEQTKLSGIAEGAEVNVQSNWTETDTASDSYIQNKPTLGTAAACNTTEAVTSGSTDLVTSGAVHSAISGLTGFHFEIVQTLPEEGETNIIYLVLKSSGETGNIYTEYAWINSAWEKLGDTQITLEYLTNAEIDTIWNSAS